MNILLEKDKNTLTTLNAIHTAQEIVQQPDLWEHTINMLLSKKEVIHNFLQQASVSKKKIIFTGAGTSEFVGNTVAPYLRQTMGIQNCSSISSTDLVLSPESYIHANDDILLVSFARSGDSPESIACIKIVEKLACSYVHLVITCNEDGALAQYVSKNNNNLVLIIEGANDKGFAMTGSFTSMLLSAAILFDIVNVEAYKTKYTTLLPLIKQWIKTIEQSIFDIVALKKTRVICLGNGYLKGIAQEAHLKVLELSASHNTAMFDTALGFRHGPKSVLNKQSIVFLFVSYNDYSRQYDIDILKELMNTLEQHYVVAISPTSLKQASSLCHKEIVIPIQDPLFYALSSIVYAQMYALENSIVLNISPDNPSPSGNVNRVVQGVTIYPY